MSEMFRRAHNRPSRRRDKHPVAAFQQAHAFWHFRAYLKAIPVLENLILEHPNHPVTELGGALLLDALTHSERITELIMWLDLMTHMGSFLDTKPQLRAIVRDHRRRYSCEGGPRNENSG